MVRRIVYCLIEIAAVALSFWLCTNFLGGIVHSVASDDLKRVVIPVIAGFICTALLGGGFSCFFTSIATLLGYALASVTYSVTYVSTGVYTSDFQDIWFKIALMCVAAGIVIDILVFVLRYIRNSIKKRKQAE